MTWRMGDWSVGRWGGGHDAETGNDKRRGVGADGANWQDCGNPDKTHFRTLCVG